MVREMALTVIWILGISSVLLWLSEKLHKKQTDGVYNREEKED